MMDKLNQIFSSFIGELQGIRDQVELLNLKGKYLGKKGGISDILKSLKDCTPEQKRELGARANEVKAQMQQALDEKFSILEREAINKKLQENVIDITDRASMRVGGQNAGGLHPLTMIQQELEDIFISMGFEVLDGPHIEDDYHNFEALNTPADHPARDMQDTFWFHDPAGEAPKKYLLRTHTSSIQVRGMESHKPPFRFVAPGKVFRCERTDASHEMVFHQMEGMLVGENISVANLIYFMKTLLSEIFKKTVEVRLRPGFFPFVEPGFELDIKCLICGGKGCSVCKNVGWLELCPCGMVHPNLFKFTGIDHKKYNGFAFGLGMDRLVMMRYGIDDIRLINSGDLRFISQFKNF